MKSIPIKQRENAPDFVLGNFGIKLSEVEQYKNDKGYVNFTIYRGIDGGSNYIKIDNWKPKEKTAEQAPTVDNEEIPF